jgi:hypothetical protein
MSIMNKFAWHVTPTRNIESIIKYGLLPNMPEEDGDLAISLFKTENDALRETAFWLEKKWNNEPLSILKIDIEDRTVTEAFDYEWITIDIETIKPEKIVEIMNLNTKQLKEAHKCKIKLSKKIS